MTAEPTTPPDPRAQPDLSVTLGPLRLAHPLVNASGTLDLFEVAESLGDGYLVDPPVAAYVPKTVTLLPRRGNEPPRVVETAAGMLNSIGLPNQGIGAFVDREMPRLLALPRPVIVNVGGFCVEDYVLAVERIAHAVARWAPGRAPAVGRDESDLGPVTAEGVADQGSSPWMAKVGLELNVSCPIVHSGCISIGSDAGELRTLVAAVRQVWPRPALLVVKLTPNVTDLPSLGVAAEQAGASALSLVNTFKGLVLDRRTLRPYLGGGTGGLSGPAIKPLALRAVWEVAQATNVPIIGMGGVTDVSDVVDMLACGASAVAVGAAGFREPSLAARLARELAGELSRRGLTLTELVGRAYLRALGPHV
jgi:dihydroorotate dehydrogenase (NAD+) catalytic subunit